MFIDLIPFIAQSLFTYANWPRIKTLLQVKMSDQHSIQNIAITLAGHIIFIPFYWIRVGTIWGILANTAAVTLAAIYLGMVLYYRKHPGGITPVQSS